jgi:diadenosine tetraphosphate (Ap4A) HIT family hydrolase
MSAIQTGPETGASSQDCAICDLRATSAGDSCLFASDLWTATLAWDVPGWIMVMLNRHSHDWLWGLSGPEAAELGPLMQRLSAAARDAAGAERVYLMGFGEQWQHFHFMLLSRPATAPPQLRGPGLLERAPELADRDEALRIGSAMRERLAADVEPGPNPITNN